MAVAPLRNVELVVEYALSEIPAEKIWMGIPNYGYDWTLPFRQGDRAQSISNQEAVALAVQNRVAIRFDQAAQSPWFRYVDGQGREHEVWFEDARSIRAKLEHPCQAGAGPLPRPVRGGLLESHAPLPSELGPAEQLIRNSAGRRTPVLRPAGSPKRRAVSQFSNRA